MNLKEESKPILFSTVGYECHCGELTSALVVEGTPILPFILCAICRLPTKPVEPENIHGAVFFKEGFVVQPSFTSS